MPTAAPARTKPSWCLILVAFVVAGCASISGSSTTAYVAEASSTSTSPVTTTVQVATTGPATAQGLDLGQSRWVTLGPEGLVSDDGSLVWPVGSQFDKAIARDRSGGLVFVEGGDLWWFPDDATEPDLVANHVPGRVVEVIATADDSVASLGFGEYVYVRLNDGEKVDAGSGRVSVDTAGNEVWSATNDWSVWIEGPQLEPADEGGPTAVIAHAKLYVADSSGSIVVDQAIGTSEEPWVRVHDFDGRTIILSRGPIEPATPPETFFVIDLGCAICTSSFTAVVTSASLTQNDPHWNGPLSFSPETLEGGS